MSIRLEPGSPPLRILVVEDNPINQQLALRMLKRLGYQADLAADGVEGLAAVHARPYDLVLMDVQMPKLDGLVTSQRIRAELPPERQPHIIALTANAAPGDHERCLAAGMDDYLSKPVSLAALAQALSKFQPAPVVVPPPALLTPSPLVALPTWDPAPLRRLAENLGPNADMLLRELVNSFYDEAGQMLPKLATSLASGAVTDLRRYAHTLKSHGATFGGLAFEALCRELERVTLAGNLEQAAQLIPRVEAEFAQLCVVLRNTVPS